MDTLQVSEYNNNQISENIKKINNIVEKYQINNLLLEIPEESLLFYNYVFKQIDAEDLFNYKYLEEIFTKIVDTSVSWHPEITKENDKFIIKFSTFKIVIEQLTFKENILINKILFVLDQEWKPQLEKDLATIRSILISFDLYKLSLSFIKDSLKIYKHKQFLKNIQQNQKDTTKLIENIKDLRNTIEIDENGHTKQDVNHIKKVFSFYLSNNLWILSTISEKSKLLENYKPKWEIDTKFHEVVNTNFNKQLSQAITIIENTNSLINTISFAANAKELIEKININIEKWNIVIVKEKVWKFDKLWWKIKWKLLNLK